MSTPHVWDAPNSAAAGAVIVHQDAAARMVPDGPPSPERKLADSAAFARSDD